MIGLRGLFVVTLVSASAFFVLPFSGCSRQAGQKYEIETEFGADPIPLDAPLTCYNEFLGITYTIPKGWQLYDLNTANLSPDRADTEDPAALDIFYGGGFRRMDMARFANGHPPAHKNHIGVYVYAEARDDSGSLDEYMPRFEESVKTCGGGDCALVDSGSETFGAKLFEKRIFELTRNNRPFRLMTLSAGFRGGYYLNIIACYWPENRNQDTIPLPQDWGVAENT